MVGGIIGWALNNRLLVLAGALALLVWGSVEALRTPVDVFPDLTAPTVTVIADAHGMAPEEVEALLTLPIETALNGANGVRRVRSKTQVGIAVVSVDFDWGTNIFQARQIVSERLQLVSASLPPGVEPPVMGPMASIMGDILFIGLTSGSHSPMELRRVGEWQVAKRLLAVQQAKLDDLQNNVLARERRALTGKMRDAESAHARAELTEKKTALEVRITGSEARNKVDTAKRDLEKARA